MCKIIREECDKLIDRHHAYHNGLHLNFLRHCKRVNNASPKVVKTPDHWAIDAKFNPFYVKRKCKSIAKSIASKIAAGTYQPQLPHTKTLPKASGGVRTLSIYQIPDAAVSRIYYKRLLEKNKHRFSSFSYAYRKDRNVHFAIQDISIDLSRNARSFIAEFDFSDFFGSISHDYLRAQLNANGFFISDEERQIIDAFLNFAQQKTGIPLGTSISLFLANLVCWRLDHALERGGLKFARYADDTLIWSPDYQKICNAFQFVNEFSSNAKIAINAKKSDGISLLTRDGLPAELKNHKTSLEFLGYSIAVDSISIKENSLRKIKKQISYLLYLNLVQPLGGSLLRGLVIPTNNEDVALLTAMLQIRRYLYGSLSSQQIRNYINGRTRRIFFKGIMSFYPLVNNQVQLKQLDGWLISTIFRALQLRMRLLKKWGFDRTNSFPFNVPRDQLAQRLYSEKIKQKRLLEVPSFMLIYKALEQGLTTRGIESVMNPESNDYDY